MLEKIISGGQTGADRAALDAAIDLHIPHGGWVPKGRRAEDGVLAGKYKLEELPTRSYPARTEKNIRDSDGTLIFTHGSLTGGSKLTYGLASKNKKPCLHVDFATYNATKATTKIIGWIFQNNIRVLNSVQPIESAISA